MASAIQREWLARAGGEIKIREMTTDELLAVKSPRLGADAVIYPSGLIGHLAAQELIAPVNKNPDSAGGSDTQDVFQLLRLREVCWGGKPHAVSLGSPQLVLICRSDVFEAQGLTPPSTWDEYRSLVEQLAQLSEDGETSWKPVLEPLGPGWAGQVLLARAAAYAKHRNQFSAAFEYGTMKPLIDGPAWTRALDDLRAVAEFFPEKATAWSPSDVRGEVLNGRYAMAITWPVRGEGPAAAEADQIARFAFAELPGATSAYNYRSGAWEERSSEDQWRVALLGISGRLGSVTRESRQAGEAANMLAWLSGELSAQICPLSTNTTLFRESHLDRADLWVNASLQAQASQYGEVVQQALSRSGWLCSPRIPGRHQYLAVLDEAVYSVLRGDADSQQALANAARKWDEITEAFGRDQQRDAYMCSIGLQP
jgi:multiple sugar transport system substrate-binding protein